MLISPCTAERRENYSHNSKSFCLSIFDHNTENKTRNTCIAEPREARGEAHKMSGMEGGEYWSKLGSLGGRVSTLALKLEGEM